MFETATLSFAGRPTLLHFGEVGLFAGVGVHRLDFGVKTHAPWLDDATAATPVLMEGFVWLDQPMKAIGALVPQVMTFRSYSVSERLLLTVSDEQLIAIDGAHDAGDLALRLNLQGTLLQAPATTHPTFATEVGYRLPLPRWLQLLDQVGMEVGISVRVPSPLSDAARREGTQLGDPPSLVQAAKRLREAREQLREGRPEMCVRSCRLVLENLNQLNPPVKVGKIPKDRSQDERWAALNEDLYSLTSAASHDDPVTEHFSWSRADAEAVLVATAGLVARTTR